MYKLHLLESELALASEKLRRALKLIYESQKHSYSGNQKPPPDNAERTVLIGRQNRNEARNSRKGTKKSPKRSTTYF